MCHCCEERALLLSVAAAAMMMVVVGMMVVVVVLLSRARSRGQHDGLKRLGLLLRLMVMLFVACVQ